jgi:hypothetical protein
LKTPTLFQYSIPMGLPWPLHIGNLKQAVVTVRTTDFLQIAQTSLVGAITAFVPTENQ